MESLTPLRLIAAIPVLSAAIFMHSQTFCDRARRTSWPASASLISTPNLGSGHACNSPFVSAFLGSRCGGSLAQGSGCSLPSFGLMAPLQAEADHESCIRIGGARVARIALYVWRCAPSTSIIPFLLSLSNCDTFNMGGWYTFGIALFAAIGTFLFG